MKKLISLSLVFVLLLSAFPLTGYAGSPEAAEAAPAGQDDLVVTEHEAVIQGQRVPYTATTGTMAVTSNLGQYEIFFTAYTRTDTEDFSTRPITFAFNGGPGSATLWLHIGFFGPAVWSWTQMAMRPSCR